MGHAHKGRPPKTTWRDLKISYQHEGKTIHETAKMVGWNDSSSTSYWWEFRDFAGHIVKIELSGIPRPKLGEE